MKTFAQLNEYLGGNEILSNWSHHKNGGGWVRNDATVHPDAYIGKEAIVWSAYSSRKADLGRFANMHGGVMWGGELIRSIMHPATYRTEINKAIKPFGLIVRAASCAGKTLGYSYFIDSKTGFQIGESVYVYRQSALTIDQWVSEAKDRRANT